MQEITTELSTTNGSDASFFQSTFLQTASGSLGDFVAIFVQRPIFSILEPADDCPCKLTTVPSLVRPGTIRKVKLVLEIVYFCFFKWERGELG